MRVCKFDHHSSQPALIDDDQKCDTSTLWQRWANCARHPVVHGQSHSEGQDCASESRSVLYVSVLSVSSLSVSVLSEIVLYVSALSVSVLNV